MSKLANSKIGGLPQKAAAKWRSATKKKKLLYIVILAIVLLLVIKACSGPKAPTQQAQEYVYEPPSRQTITATLSGTGTVQPVNSYTVLAVVTGDVLNAPFEEGEVIKSGQLLYQIDPDQAQNNYTQAQLQLRAAQEEADKLNVCAPAAGQIVKIYPEQGDDVNPGELLFDLQDRQNMELKLPFLAAEAQQLSVGAPATVSLQATGETLSGKITEVSAVQEVAAGGAITREVTISVQNPGGLTEGTVASAQAGGFVCADSGSFAYTSSKQITAETGGSVSSILVHEGDTVTKGQTLMHISSTTVENSLQSAQLSLKNAQANLDDYTITSPIDGTVIEKNFKEGDTIDSSNNASKMAIIYDMSQLEFTLDIDELDIGQIAVGQQVEITADALEGQTFQGVVSKISINGSSKNGVTTYPITVTIDEAGDLLPGMNINATVIMSKAEDVLAIPVGAVSRGNLVMVKATEGETGVDNPALQPPEGYIWREVELGVNDSDYIEIKSGLTETDTVAIPANGMPDGLDMGAGYGSPAGGPPPGGPQVKEAA